MEDGLKLQLRVMPSAAPSEADIAAWQALPRDEQLRRLRLSLTQPDCAVATAATMGDVLTDAKECAEARRRG